MPAAGSTVPARTLMFNYDENNSPVGFQFKSDVSNYWYFYVFAKNAQGDITSIYRRDVDANGKTYLSHIADYEYDPWGRVLSVKDSTGRDISNESNNSAAINPFRYRGYYYDTESGFYYLQSRYYDPVIKRFINADTYASTGQGYLGYNMYAYCKNNPVCNADPYGSRMVSEIDEYIREMGGYGGCALSEEEKTPNVLLYSEHKSNAHEANREKHEGGETRRKRDQRGEKGNSRRKDRSNKRNRVDGEESVAQWTPIVPVEEPSFWERAGNGLAGVGIGFAIFLLAVDNIAPMGVADDVYIDQLTNEMTGCFEIAIR